MYQTLDFLQQPFSILAIGIACVLGLILILRVHAFLALITSAIIVSLLAPGETAVKISRVADAFGKSAGQIAIVIALAAIIGECMMLSGAADRVVQAFLNLLGQKRAPWALMGSGYVLAVPVFFDTVFYLLVPLARSLYRRTGKNYLLCLLAIAAGGAITHTLVPPTPGPLVMASTLGVDVGTMILIGGIVAMPAAVAGLAISRLLDRWLTIPFRDDNVVGTEDDHPEVPQYTPPLWAALLPVVLPVLLISAKTALETLADNEHVTQLHVADVRDWGFLADGEQADLNSPSGYLYSQLSPEAHELLRQGTLSEADRATLLAEMNRLMQRKSPLLYSHEPFDAVVWKPWRINEALEAAKAANDQPAIERLERQQALNVLLKGDLSALKVNERERAHRMLLEVAFPEAIALHQPETRLRRAADIAGVIGDPNLALLLSAVVALILFYQAKRPTLTQMSTMVEAALMSGGTIILITAAGGAFGAMLKAANIAPEIERAFEHSSAQQGIIFLVLGYGVSSLMKIAQGSSTVAMITVSGMLASMVAPIDLGFHPVYLATSIGAGSLMGSWMNDSGFWIFTKMGRLTESESLRSWTIMLMVLSVTSFATTVLLSQILPLN